MENAHLYYSVSAAIAKSTSPAPQTKTIKAHTALNVFVLETPPYHNIYARNTFKKKNSDIVSWYISPQHMDQYHV